MNRRLLAAIAVVVVVVILVISLRKPAIECPNHSYPVVTETDTFDFVPLAGEITQIPEYHDCQRLLEARGTQYGALIGIWVAEDLANRAASLVPIPGLPPGQPDSVGGGSGSQPVLFTPPPTAKAFIQIFAWDGGYGPLGIHQRWNCLYLYPKNMAEIGAWMVPVDEREDCLQDLVLADVPSNAKELFVSRVVPETTLGEDPVPAVGRWDWDTQHLTQYIGVKCGVAWCEVTPDKEYQPSARYNAGGDSEQQKVYTIKAWYDEQHLAVKQTFRAARPSPVVGTIIPDPAIGTYKLEDFGQWRVTGYVALSEDLAPYADRFNFVKVAMPIDGTPAALTEIAMCHGSNCFPDGDAPKCAERPDQKDSEKQWWARFTTPTRPVKYRCVKRVDHGPHDVPATARWWWEAMDETGWMRCAEGCCSPN